jgi:nicotinamidase-related amidase
MIGVRPRLRGAAASSLAKWRAAKGGSAMLPCLLVIDVQQSFVRRPYFQPEGVAAFLQAQNALIEAFCERRWPIVRIFHISPGGQAEDPFSKASGLVRPLEGLRAFEASASFDKTRHSALVGTGLEVWLREAGINTLVISGIRTEQCCETTARHASDIGFKVHYVGEATLTFDMHSLDGAALHAAAIRERTEAVLQGRFAQVQTVEACLQSLERPRG